MGPCYLPILFDVGDSFVLLVGGGVAAHSKLSALLPFQPRLRLVAPEISPETEELARAFPHHELHRREWKKADFKGVALVYVFTNSETINGRVAREAKKRRIPSNVAARRGQGGFLSPAAAKVGSWVLAVSSQGSDPRRAVRFRDLLVSVLKNELAQLSDDASASQGGPQCICP